MKTAWARAFEKACRTWQARFGLFDWTIRYAAAVGNKSDVAQVHYDNDTREVTATVYTDTKSSEPASRVALHEMLHLVLADTIYLAAKRGDDEHPDVVREEHRAIERLINVMEGRL